MIYIKSSKIYFKQNLLKEYTNCFKYVIINMKKIVFLYKDYFFSLSGTYSKRSSRVHSK